MALNTHGALLPQSKIDVMECYVVEVPHGALPRNFVVAWRGPMRTYGHMALTAQLKI